MKQNNWVGVDTHKETLACFKNGNFKEFKTNEQGFESALKWAGDDSKWAVEGAYCYGRPFTFFLVRNGCKVYEINPLLTKNWRRVISTANSKNDFGDAKVISMFADEANAQEISFKTVELKEKLTARNLAVKQRKQIVSSIKMLYSQRGKELPFKDLTTQKAVKYISSHEDIILRNFGKLLISLNSTIKEIEKDIKTNLPEKARKLMQLKGIKELLLQPFMRKQRANCTPESH